MSYLSNKDRNLKELIPENIEQFLMTKGYFIEEGIIPGIINPDGIIDFLPTSIDWKKIPRTQAIDILIEKPDKGVRRFSLLHPYIYRLLVKEIVDNIVDIKKRLLRPTGVSVYSIPQMNILENMAQDWKYFYRIDPAAHLQSHPFIVTADISNLYESIYTHAIAWGVHGVEVAKNGINNYDLLGNRLDKLFQNAHDGQTNGIPTGNTISDIAAELVLKNIDEAIGVFVEEHHIVASRYRDDYMFMCKNKNEARAILDKLAIELSKGYGLTINRSKVKFMSTEEYVDSLVIKAAPLQLPEGFSQSSDFIIRGSEVFNYIHELKKIAKNESRMFDAGVKRIVDKLKNEPVVLIGNDFDEWAALILAEVFDAIQRGYSSSGVVYLFLDKVIELSSMKNMLIDLVINEVNNSSNVMREIWTYALLKRHEPGRIDTFMKSRTSPLLLIAAGTLDHMEAFTTRDILPTDIKKAYSGFRAVDINLFDEINEDEMIASILESEYYNSILRSHYDD